MACWGDMLLGVRVRAGDVGGRERGSGVGDHARHMDQKVLVVHTDLELAAHMGPTWD